MRKRLALLAAVFTAIAVFAGVALADSADFGQFVQRQLGNQSEKLYGFNGPLEASSANSITKAEAQADPRKLATVAKSLKVNVVSAGVAPPCWT